MKKLIVLIAFIFTALSANSQTFYGVPVDSIESNIILADVKATFAGQFVGVQRKVKVSLDVGQFAKVNLKGKDYIKDKDGKVMTFNSVVDFILFMDAAGFEYVDRVAMAMGGTQAMNSVGMSIMFKRRNYETAKFEH